MHINISPYFYRIVIFESVEENGGDINFQDLDGDTVTVNDQEELKEKVIEEYIDITDDIETLIDLELEELES